MTSINARSLIAMPIATVPSLSRQASPAVARPPTEAEAARHAREVINGMPVSSSVMSLSNTLSGISLTFGASRAGVRPELDPARLATDRTSSSGAPDRIESVGSNDLAARVSLHYSAIEAAGRASPSVALPA